MFLVLGNNKRLAFGERYFIINIIYIDIKISFQSEMEFSRFSDDKEHDETIKYWVNMAMDKKK